MKDVGFSWNLVDIVVQHILKWTVCLCIMHSLYRSIEYIRFIGNKIVMHILSLLSFSLWKLVTDIYIGSVRANRTSAPRRANRTTWDKNQISATSRIFAHHMKVWCLFCPSMLFQWFSLGISWLNARLKSVKENSSKISRECINSYYNACTPL